MKYFRIGLILFLLTLLSCSEENTEIALRIELGSLNPQDIPNRLILKGEVEGEEKFSREYDVKESDFPFDILITSESGVEYVMTFDVRAYNSDRLVAEVSTTAKFIKHKRVNVTVVLKGVTPQDAGYDISELPDRTELPDITEDIVKDVLNGDEESDILTPHAGSDAEPAGDTGICPFGYMECDNNPLNGCETNILSDKKNCGYCKNECTLDNAESDCVHGECKVVKCSSGFENCDNKDENGCEANLSKDPHHCGDCSTDCGDNSECNNKSCGCALGFGNCDTLWSNGCETDLSNNDSHCGRCNNPCPYRTHCVNSKCVCDEGFGDCDGNANNGCEASINTDKDNCGECGKKCELQNVKNAFCKDKSCDYDECLIEYTDADKDRTNGCETWSYFPKVYTTVEEDNYLFFIYAFNNSYFVSFIVQNSSTKEMKTIISKLDRNGDFIWSKSYDGIIFVKNIHYLNGYIYIFGEMRDKTLSNPKLLVLKITETGNVNESFTIDGLTDFILNRVSYSTDGKILLCGELNESGHKKGFFITIDNNGSINAKKIYLEQNPDYNISIYDCMVFDNKYIITANKIVFQVGSTVMKGYILLFDNDLSLMKSLTLSNELNISFKIMSINPFNKIIIGGTNYKAVANTFNSIILAKIFINGSNIIFEGTKNFYCPNRNLNLNRIINVGSTFYSIIFSEIPDGMSIKDPKTHIIKNDGDLNLVKSRVFYSDLFYYGVPFGMLNLLESYNNRVLTNLFPIISGSPINSMMIELDEDLIINAKCPTDFLYDFNLESTDISLNFVSEPFVTETINMTLSPVNLQINDYQSIQSNTYCNKK
jgi:hypothetical protein